MLNINKKIKDRRMMLNLTDIEVAKQVGLSIHEYSDIEQHADEVFDVVKIRAVKNIERIGTVLFLLGTEPPFYLPSSIPDSPRHSSSVISG
ncbi:MAG: hypothetical protein ABFD75_08810 [Smithella sp.]